MSTKSGGADPREESTPDTMPLVNTPTSKALSRAVTVFGEHAPRAFDRTSGKKWASCPAALWDPTARPKPDPKTGRIPKLRFGTTRRLGTTFAHEYYGDCYAVAYIVVNPNGHVVPNSPRLNKPELHELLARGYRLLFSTQWADIDEPDHRALTDDRWSMYLEVLSKYDCAYYRTRAGARVIRGYTRPLGPAEYEVGLSRWLPELRSLFASVPAVVVDNNCTDWTRFMRVPRCLRDDDGVITNTWDTNVYTDRLTLADPGDCTAPVKIIIAPPKPIVVGGQGDTRYGLKALANACDTIATSQDGARHTLIFRTAAVIGNLVAGGELLETTAQPALEHAIGGLDEHQRALRDGFAKGLSEPRSAPRRDHFDLHALRQRMLDRLQAADDGDFSF